MRHNSTFAFTSIVNFCYYLIRPQAGTKKVGHREYDRRGQISEVHPPYCLIVMVDALRLSALPLASIFKVGNRKFFDRFVQNFPDNGLICFNLQITVTERISGAVLV